MNIAAWLQEGLEELFPSVSHREESAAGPAAGAREPRTPATGRERRGRPRVHSEQRLPRDADLSLHVMEPLSEASRPAARSLDALQLHSVGGATRRHRHRRYEARRRDCLQRPPADPPAAIQHIEDQTWCWSGILT